MLQLRTATLDDLSILLEFEQGLIVAERPMDATLKREDTLYYDLPFILNNENFELVVAEIDKKVVGCGYARKIKARQCFQFDDYSYLGFMFTLPEYRGRGVNKAIMEYLYDWSLSHGIYEIRLEVYPTNEPAIKAYEKAGMHTSMQTMRVDLRDRKK